VHLHRANWRSPSDDKEKIMRFAAFVSAASLAVMSTVAMAQSITYDFDRSANFAAFKTYAWVRGTAVDDPINHKRVVDAVSAQLVAKGLTRTEVGEVPDLLVAYHASFDRDLRISGFSTGWGPYRLRRGSAVARTEQILTGTLVVDVVDARTNNIVWRGTASKEVDASADPATRERNIRRAAERLFKNYPTAK
jgi:hypothetical protein